MQKEVLSDFCRLSYGLVGLHKLSCTKPVHTKKDYLKIAIRIMSYRNMLGKLPKWKNFRKILHTPAHTSYANTRLLKWFNLQEKDLWLVNLSASIFKVPRWFWWADRSRTKEQAIWPLLVLLVRKKGAQHCGLCSLWIGKIIFISFGTS